MSDQLTEQAQAWAAMWFDDASTAKECDAEAWNLAQARGSPVTKIEIALLRLGAGPDLSLCDLDGDPDGRMAAELLRSAIDDLKNSPPGTDCS